MVGWLVLLGEAFWSSCQESHNIFKVRLMIKVLLLSILHYSALYLCAVVMAAEVFFLLLEWKLVERRFPKLWLAANILPNGALLLLIEFSHSLISIYSASAMLVVAMVVEFVIAYKEYYLNKLSNALRIEGKTKNEFTRTLGVLNKEKEKHEVVLGNELDGFMIEDNLVEVKEKVPSN